MFPGDIVTMHVLLTNDDGIFAPGLAAMYNQLSKIAEVTVAAPSDVKSAASHSISLEPLVCDKIELAGKFTGYSVNGSPADCVKLAINKLVDTSTNPIDLVVAGINHGANVGINVYYSGTVAAAMEAAFYNIPAIAVSAAFEEDLDVDAASQYALALINKLLPLQAGNVININIPKLSMGKPKGIKVVPQSTRGFDENYVTQRSKDGQTSYQLTGGSHRDKEAAFVDTITLTEGFITVTALHFDMTDHAGNDRLGEVKW